MISEGMTTEEGTHTSTGFHFMAGTHPMEEILFTEDIRLEAIRTIDAL